MLLFKELIIYTKRRKILNTILPLIYLKFNRYNFAFITSLNKLAVNQIISTSYFGSESISYNECYRCTFNCVSERTMIMCFIYKIIAIIILPFSCRNFKYSKLFIANPLNSFYGINLSNKITLLI